MFKKYKCANGGVFFIFNSYEKQIQSLKQKNLQFTPADEKRLKYLNNISFEPYLKFFRDDGKFIGITCQQIINLYDFDCELRAFGFILIRDIEVAFRAIFINCFFQNYDEKLKDLSDDFKAFINEFQEKNKKKYSSIDVHFLQHMFSNISFGTLNKLYFDNSLNSNFHHGLLADVNIQLDIKLFKSWISFCVYIRNIVSHHGVLFNCNFKKMPKVPKKNNWHKIFDKQKNNKFPIFVIIAFYLLKGFHSPLVPSFKENLRNIFNNYQNIDLEKMGFCENIENFVKRLEE